MSLAFRPSDVLPEKPLTEDAFYQLSVAANLAQHRGLTIDGEHWTNGFQPLFTLLCTPLYWLTGGDRFETLAWVLGLETILEVAAAWLMALIVRDSLRSTPGAAHNGFWLAITFYLGSGTLLLQHHNGLETGLLLCLYAAIARNYQVHGNRNAGRNLVLGVFLGLLVLARVDAVFLSLSLPGPNGSCPVVLATTGTVPAAFNHECRDIGSLVVLQLL